MPKVEIDFDSTFESAKPIPIPVGRIYVGKQHLVVRMIFSPTGEVTLLVPQAAIDVGAVKITPLPSVDTVFGFPPG